MMMSLWVLRGTDALYHSLHIDNLVQCVDRGDIWREFLTAVEQTGEYQLFGVFHWGLIIKLQTPGYKYTGCI